MVRNLIFYNGLNPKIKMIIDAVAGGALMGKERDEAYELLEEMASNSYQWQSDRAMPRKATRVHDIDAFTAIYAQLALLTKKLNATNVSAIQTQNLLAQRPIALVLMMINSCSYRTNDLVFI